MLVKLGLLLELKKVLVSNASDGLLRRADDETDSSGESIRIRLKIFSVLINVGVLSTPFTNKR